MIRAALARLAGALWRRLGLAPIGENNEPAEPWLDHGEHLDTHRAFARRQRCPRDPGCELSAGHKHGCYSTPDYLHGA